MREIPTPSCTQPSTKHAKGRSRLKPRRLRCIRASLLVEKVDDQEMYDAIEHDLIAEV